MSTGSSRRSQRRFNVNLARYVAEHITKLDEEKLSLPSHLGKLVITVSNAPDHKGGLTPEEQRKAFMEEAEQIAEKRSGQHSEVVIKRKTVARELSMDIADQEVSDLVLIGHGNIGDMWTDEGGHFGAFDVAKSTRHLKQGSIEQRICGHFPLRTSVPLGTFALRDQRKLIAPLGEVIDDIDPDESLFVPVYDKALNTADDIRELISDFYYPDE